MERCDVLIVGGGPAGSSCAWKLAGSGLGVLIMDRKKFPRDKPCAGWITPALIDSLELDLKDYAADGRILQPITKFVVGLIGGPEVEANYDRPISYGIRRFEFDHYLLGRAVGNNLPCTDFHATANSLPSPLRGRGVGGEGGTPSVRCRLGDGVKSVERDASEWVINGEIRSKMLVGAGGHFCPIARHLGAKELKTPAVVAQEIEVPLTSEQLRDCPVEPGVPYLHFCPDLKGYGWFFRKGNYLNVGLGREDDEKLSDHVAAYAEGLKAAGRIPRDLPLRFPGHAYLLYPRSQRTLIGDGVLLVGDAAGTAYSPSGEGIRPAVESGLIAGDLIATLGGDYGRERLEPFKTRFTARFGQKSKGSIADLLPAGLKRLVAGRLMAWGWFSRSVVVDQWFLRRAEPVLRLRGQVV
jgi:flavin-dependent dehydrogenase